MPVLTAIDLLGIQRFVFASNRLRDVVGASLLVARACGPSGDSPVAKLPPEQRLVAAGGNAILRFDDRLAAHGFTARFTRWLHDEAPGFEAVVAHREYNPGELARATRALQVEVARAKSERRPTVPLPGLSVTESCHETGRPAVTFGRLGNTQAPISRGIELVRAAWKGDRDPSRWARDLPRLVEVAQVTLACPREIDHLGRSHGDTSLVAVVHIDGNGIGASLRAWLERQVGDDVDDDAFWRRFSALSGSLDELASNAMKAVMERVARSLRTRVVTRDGKDTLVTSVTTKVHDLDFALHRLEADDELGDEAGASLPVWPVLVGGDDLTFVCDARIALDLATTALTYFSSREVEHLGPVTASAGLAMVRSHTPFLRAYELSERLCRSAKKKRVNDEQVTALDWHLGDVRPGESLEDLRARQYNGGQLSARPMVLGDAHTPGTWCWLDAALLSPDGEHSLRGEHWGVRRNKVKALREHLREGAPAVEKILAAWRRVDPELDLPPNTPLGEATPLLDAIELLDVHAPLDPDRDSSETTP